MSKINYEQIETPDNSNYEDWSYAQRRAYLLQKIKNAGHPRLINQREIAKQFGVDPSQINYDINAIADSVNEYLGKDAVFKLDTIYDNKIEELIEKGKDSELRHWVKDFKEFLQEYGAIKKEPDKQKVEHEGEIKHKHEGLFEQLKAIRESMEDG